MSSSASSRPASRRRASSSGLSSAGPNRVAVVRWSCTNSRAPGSSRASVSRSANRCTTTPWSLELAARTRRAPRGPASAHMTSSKSRSSTLLGVSRVELEAGSVHDHLPELADLGVDVEGMHLPPCACVTVVLGARAAARSSCSRSRGRPGCRAGAAPPAIRNGPQTTYQLSPVLREYQMNGERRTPARRPPPPCRGRTRGVCRAAGRSRRHLICASAENAYGMAAVMPVISTSVVNTVAPLVPR